MAWISSHIYRCQASQRFLISLRSNPLNEPYQLITSIDILLKMGDQMRKVFFLFFYLYVTAAHATGQYGNIEEMKKDFGSTIKVGQELLANVAKLEPMTFEHKNKVNFKFCQELMSKIDEHSKPLSNFIVYFQNGFKEFNMCGKEEHGLEYYYDTVDVTTQSGNQISSVFTVIDNEYKFTMRILLAKENEFREIHYFEHKINDDDYDVAVMNVTPNGDYQSWRSYSRFNGSSVLAVANFMNSDFNFFDSKYVSKQYSESSKIFNRTAKKDWDKFVNLAALNRVFIYSGKNEVKYTVDPLNEDQLSIQQKDQDEPCWTGLVIRRQDVDKAQDIERHDSASCK